MAKQLSRVHDVIVLRNSATAITATTSDSSKSAARLRGFHGGFAVVTIAAIDATSSDETYTIAIEGRDTVGSGSYTSLGSVALTATGSTAVAGVYLVDLDVTKKEMRVTATLGGTTPSLTYSVNVIVPALSTGQYAPSGAAITT